MTLHCSPLMGPAVIMRTLEGVAREGAWACFSDAGDLAASSLSVLSQVMQIISTALHAKRDTFALSVTRKVTVWGDRRNDRIMPLFQVTLRPDLGIFLTSTPATLTSPHWTPPPSLSPLLRTFSFPLPDPTVVVKAHCTALGFKSPKALANKLITLRDYAQKLL